MAHSDYTVQIPHLARLMSYRPGAALTAAQKQNIDGKAHLIIGLFGLFGVGKSALGDTILSYATGRWNNSFEVATSGVAQHKTMQWMKGEISATACIYDNRGSPDTASKKVSNVISRQLRGYYNDADEVDWVDDNWFQSLFQSGKSKGRINSPVLVISSVDTTATPDDFKPMFDLFKRVVGCDPVVVLTKTDYPQNEQRISRQQLASALNIKVDNIYCIRCLGSEREWETHKNNQQNMLEINLLCSALARQADLILYKESKEGGCVLL